MFEFELDPIDPQLDFQEVVASLVSTAEGVIAEHPELRNAADTLRSGTASRLYAVHPPMNIHVHVLTYRAWGVRVGACDRNVPISESEWRTSEEVGLFSVLRSHDLPFACLDNKHSLAQIATFRRDWWC